MVYMRPRILKYLRGNTSVFGVCCKAAKSAASVLWSFNSTASTDGRGRSNTTSSSFQDDEEDPCFAYQRAQTLRQSVAAESEIRAATAAALAAVHPSIKTDTKTETVEFEAADSESESLRIAAIKDIDIISSAGDSSRGKPETDDIDSNTQNETGGGDDSQVSRMEENVSVSARLKIILINF